MKKTATSQPKAHAACKQDGISEGSPPGVVIHFLLPRDCLLTLKLYPLPLLELLLKAVHNLTNQNIQTNPSCTQRASKMGFPRDPPGSSCMLLGKVLCFFFFPRSQVFLGCSIPLEPRKGLRDHGSTYSCSQPTPVVNLLLLMFVLILLTLNLLPTHLGVKVHDCT